jgi:hypothetical protein
MNRAVCTLVILVALAVRGQDAPQPVPTPAVPAPAISVTNYTDGETIRYPVALLRGTLSDETATEVTVANTSSTRDTREMKGLASKGKFKALMELVPGPNKLIIRAGANELPLTIQYQPQTNNYIVRIIYLTDNTGNTEYQTPLPNDPQHYAAKLDAMMKLLQTFTAERLHDLGFGRQTFNLELDDQGKVKVHVFKSPAPAETYYKMPDQAWWGAVAGMLEKPFPTKFGRNIAIPAYTRFDPETKKARGHTALGGGGLALFGSGNMFTWPNKLADAQAAFMNETAIDHTKVFSDSVGRHTFWAAASTTIGAVLHELGHTFGLPHSREPHDIMTRGIDRFNRAFTFVDPPHAGSKTARSFNDTTAAVFPPVSAAALVTCRWLALDQKDWNDRAKMSASLDDQGNIVVESDTDIRFVGFDAHAKDKEGKTREVLAAYHVVPPAGQAKRVVVPLAEVRKRVKEEEFGVRVIDDQWNFRHENSKTLLNGPFVRAWQFSPLTAAWTNASAFVPVDDKRLKEIADSAAGAKLTANGSNFVDFLESFPRDKQVQVAGYACRSIKSAAPRTIKLFTGSDDAIRVWLNGKVVLEKLALRGAQPDSDSAPAELRAGENTLVVEVSQGGGGWGLYLRVEDDAGKKLRLTDAGELVETAPVK